jgi:hypothetical protein
MSIAPNPGFGRARLEFQLPAAGRLDVGIYDVTGRLLARLGGNRFAGGRQSVVWDGTAGGAQVASGVYFMRGVLAADGRRMGVTDGRIVVRR